MKVRLSGIQVKIMWKLRRRGKIGGSHTPYDSAVRGFPGHLGGDVKEALDNLITKEWILTKPTSYGLEVSLNQQQLKAINMVCDWYTARAGGIDYRIEYEIEIG